MAKVSTGMTLFIDFTRHAEAQMIERKISKQEVKECVHPPTKVNKTTDKITIFKRFCIDRGIRKSWE